MPPPTTTETNTVCYCVDEHHRADTVVAINEMEESGWRVRQLMPLLEGSGGALVACTTQVLCVFERDV